MGSVVVVVDGAGAGAAADTLPGLLFAGGDFDAGAAAAAVEELVSPGCAPPSLDAQQLSFRYAKFTKNPTRMIQNENSRCMTQY